MIIFKLKILFFDRYGLGGYPSLLMHNNRITYYK